MIQARVRTMVVAAAVIGLLSAGWLRAEGLGPLERRPLLEFVFENLGRLAKLRRQLDLTGEQRKTLVAMLKGRKPEIVEAMGKVRSGRKKVLAAVRAEPASEAGIREAVGSMTGALGDAAVLRSSIRRDALALLTPKQRGQVDRFMEEVHASSDEAFADFSGRAR